MFVIKQTIKVKKILFNFINYYFINLHSISNPFRVPTECRHHGGKTIRTV